MSVATVKTSARRPVPGDRQAASYPASHWFTIARSVICPMVPDRGGASQPGGSVADRDLAPRAVVLRLGGDGDRTSRRDAPRAPGHGRRVQDVAGQGRGGEG